MPEQLEVGLLEQVDIWVVLIEGAEEEGVYAEERAELLVEVGLLDVRAGGGRYPEVLRVALKRNISLSNNDNKVEIRTVSKHNAQISSVENIYKTYGDAIVDEAEGAHEGDHGCEEDGCARVGCGVVAYLEEDLI